MPQDTFDPDSRIWTLSHWLQLPVRRSPFHHSTPLHPSRAQTISGSKLINFVRAWEPTQLKTRSGRLLFSIPKPLVRYCVPRIVKQSYRTTLFLCDHLNIFCRIISLPLVVRLSDSWSHMPISRQWYFSGNLTNNGSGVYAIYIFNHHVHFPAQINTYPVNIFRFNFSYRLPVRSRREPFFASQSHQP